MSRDIYKEVTDSIIQSLEKGVAPWVRPWSSAPGGLPHNLISGRRYSGINTVLLTMVGQLYSGSGWATYNQIRNAGGQVRKGERGAHVVLFKRIEVKDKKADDPDATKHIGLLRFFVVFNRDQADWPEGHKFAVNPADTSGDDVVDLPEAEATIAATGAVIRHGGDRAFFVPSQDFIKLPAKKSFESMGHYYCTLFHELTHWSGGKARLDRKLSNSFGSSDYAFEELTAEIGSAFLCAEHGIDGELRHAEYLASWIKVMKEDNKVIFRAAAAAQRAVDFIMKRSAVEEKEEESEAIAA